MNEGTVSGVRLNTRLTVWKTVIIVERYREAARFRYILMKHLLMRPDARCWEGTHTRMASAIQKSSTLLIRALVALSFSRREAISSSCSVHQPCPRSLGYVADLAHPVSVLRISLTLKTHSAQLTLAFIFLTSTALCCCSLPYAMHACPMVNDDTCLVSWLNGMVNGYVKRNQTPSPYASELHQRSPILYHPSTSISTYPSPSRLVYF